ncbi:HalOD1 output domain-containing protein [Haloarcula laminariae]|uniref:HalOD1 output domain-containing protein n=1 Tax=Haloarcula laminariae TaxID=2961577 RepID=UPI0024064D82|nr:HalOD1 output domain-containing protein [Halomicroarcula sp. FL173]
MADEGTVTHAVVSAVARAEGVDPTDVEPPLSKSVDTEALERLFRDTRGHVTFEYKEYVVTVSSDGDVALEPLVT